MGQQCLPFFFVSGLLPLQTDQAKESRLIVSDSYIGSKGKYS